LYSKKRTADIIENYYQKCPKLNLENRIFTHKNYYNYTKGISLSNFLKTFISWNNDDPFFRVT